MNVVVSTSSCAGKRLDAATLPPGRSPRPHPVHGYLPSALFASDRDHQHHRIDREFGKAVALIEALCRLGDRVHEDRADAAEFRGLSTAQGVAQRSSPKPRPLYVRSTARLPSTMTGIGSGMPRCTRTRRRRLRDPACRQGVVAGTRSRNP